MNMSFAATSRRVSYNHPTTAIDFVSLQIYKFMISAEIAKKTIKINNN